MYNHYPTVNGKRPFNQRESSPFGVEDRPPCPSCGAEMNLFRRSPEPVHHGYEVQMFSCMECDAVKIALRVRHAALSFRRSPEPVHHGYEVQMFSCMECDAEFIRSADRTGKPHPTPLIIELETLSPSIARAVGE